MYAFTSLVLLVAVGLLLRFVSQKAKHLEFKKHSPLWIGVIWAVSIGATLLFRHYYEMPIVIYILFSTGIATITYLLVAHADISGSLVFSVSNTVALLAVMFYFGMLGGRTESTLTSGDVLLVADEVCQCVTNQTCLETALPKMKKMIKESQTLTGHDAIIAANAVAKANHCTAKSTIKSKQKITVTFLDEWDKEVDYLIDHQRITTNGNRVVNRTVEKTPFAPMLTPAVGFQEVTITELNGHMGDILRLTKENGKVLNGWLIADKGSKIILKQKLSGGYVNMPIAKRSISLLEVKPNGTIR